VTDIDFALLDVPREVLPDDAKPQIPHDGFLADFLMRNKGFIQT
jgi:hypothetical protein